MPSLNSTARRRLNSQIGQPSPEFLELFSRKSGSGLLDAWGLPVLPLPDTVGQIQLRLHFHRSEFLERNSRKSGWQASHKQGGKAAGSPADAPEATPGFVVPSLKSA
jgi:hypothetical protein